MLDWVRSMVHARNTYHWFDQFLFLFAASVLPVCGEPAPEQCQRTEGGSQGGHEGPGEGRQGEGRRREQVRRISRCR